MNEITLSRRQRAATSAFTLLEILVVIAIIGLLVGLVVSNMTDVLGKNEVKIAKLFVDATMTQPITRYRLDTRSFPSTTEGLQALITRPSSISGWSGPYIEGGKVPLDPWGTPYQYAFPAVKSAKEYDLWSMGPDKINGTADDVGNWPESTQTEGETK